MIERWEPALGRSGGSRSAAARRTGRRIRPSDQLDTWVRRAATADAIHDLFD